jgi:hypothetical protein
MTGCTIFVVADSTAGGMGLGIAVLRNIEGERSYPKSWSASFANFELSLVGCV